VKTTSTSLPAGRSSPRRTEWRTTPCRPLWRVLARLMAENKSAKLGQILSDGSRVPGGACGQPKPRQDEGGPIGDFSLLVEGKCLCSPAIGYRCLLLRRSPSRRVQRGHLGKECPEERGRMIGQLGSAGGCRQTRPAAARCAHASAERTGETPDGRQEF
jgi:hypothetical protein